MMCLIPIMPAEIYLGFAMIPIMPSPMLMRRSRYVQLMQAVEELGQERKTFVLVTSDRRCFCDVVAVDN